MKPHMNIAGLCHIRLLRLLRIEEEIRNPLHSIVHIDEPALFIAKYGAQAGLRLGFGNTFREANPSF